LVKANLSYHQEEEEIPSFFTEQIPTALIRHSESCQNRRVAIHSSFKIGRSGLSVPVCNDSLIITANGWQFIGKHGCPFCTAEVFL